MFHNHLTPSASCRACAVISPLLGADHCAAQARTKRTAAHQSLRKWRRSLPLYRKGIAKPNKGPLFARPGAELDRSPEHAHR